MQHADEILKSIADKEILLDFYHLSNDELIQSISSFSDVKIRKFILLYLRYSFHNDKFITFSFLLDNYSHFLKHKPNDILLSVVTEKQLDLIFSFSKFFDFDFLDCQLLINFKDQPELYSKIFDHIESERFHKLF
jgi:hypothetical protein